MGTGATLASVLILVSVALSSGVVSSLLTTIFSPGVQHHFWKRQLRTELQLQVVGEIQRVCATVISAKVLKRPETPESLEKLITLRAQVHDLFSPAAAHAFGQLQDLLLDKTIAHVVEYDKVRYSMTKILYNDMGI